MKRVQALMEADQRRRFEYALPYRWRLVWEVGVTTGLRISDILLLTREQVHKGYFRMTEQKTGKKRDVKLDDKLRRDLLNFSGFEYVFCSPRDPSVPISRQSAWAAFKKAATEARLDASVGTHTARRTFAKTLHSVGASVRDVQAALNHSSPITTLAYLFDHLL